MVRSRNAAPLVSMAGALLGLAGFVAGTPSAHAYVYSSEAQYAQWSSGSYTVYNDVWGNSNPSQWLNINSWNSWNIVSNQTGGGIKSYANVSFRPNTSIWGYGIWAYFNASTPSGAAYDNSFDCWTDHGDEIMIWENWHNVSPAGSVKVSSVSVGGSTWTVWQGWVGHNCVSFTRSGQRWSGTEEPTAIIQWARNNGYVAGSTITQVQFGFEVTNTQGWQTFYLNSYNAGW